MIIFKKNAIIPCRIANSAYICTPQSGNKQQVIIYESEYKTCESSSVGRARPCQGRGREFESRLSLKSLPKQKGFIFEGLDTSGSDGGTGRHAGLKILFP